MQHAGELDVVDVVALAAQEPRVLLAQHPAVADRLLVVVVEDARGMVLDGGHDALPAGTVSGVSLSPARAARSWSAAQWTERTMVA